MDGGKGMIINERDRVQIDSAKYSKHYKNEFGTMRDVLDYVASLQRQIDRLSKRVYELEKKLDDDSK